MNVAGDHKESTKKSHVISNGKLLRTEEVDNVKGQQGRKTRGEIKRNFVNELLHEIEKVKINEDDQEDGINSCDKSIENSRRRNYSKLLSELQSRVLALCDSSMIIDTSLNNASQEDLEHCPTLKLDYKNDALANSEPPKYKTFFKTDKEYPSKSTHIFKPKPHKKPARFHNKTDTVRQQDSLSEETNNFDTINDVNYNIIYTQCLHNEVDKIEQINKDNKGLENRNTESKPTKTIYELTPKVVASNVQKLVESCGFQVISPMKTKRECFKILKSDDKCNESETDGETESSRNALPDSQELSETDSCFAARKIEKSYPRSTESTYKRHLTPGVKSANKSIKEVCKPVFYNKNKNTRNKIAKPKNVEELVRYVKEQGCNEVNLIGKELFNQTHLSSSKVVDKNKSGAKLIGLEQSTENKDLTNTFFKHIKFGSSKQVGGMDKTKPRDEDFQDKAVSSSTDAIAEPKNLKQNKNNRINVSPIKKDNYEDCEQYNIHVKGKNISLSYEKLSQNYNASVPDSTTSTESTDPELVRENQVCLSFSDESSSTNKTGADDANKNNKNSTRPHCCYEDNFKGPVCRENTLSYRRTRQDLKDFYRTRQKNMRHSPNGNRRERIESDRMNHITTPCAFHAGRHTPNQSCSNHYNNHSHCRYEVCEPDHECQFETSADGEDTSAGVESIPIGKDNHTSGIYNNENRWSGQNKRYDRDENLNYNYEGSCNFNNYRGDDRQSIKFSSSSKRAGLSGKIYKDIEQDKHRAGTLHVTSRPSTITGKRASKAHKARETCSEEEEYDDDEGCCHGALSDATAYKGDTDILSPGKYGQKLPDRYMKYDMSEMRNYRQKGTHWERGGCGNNGKKQGPCFWEQERHDSDFTSFKDTEECGLCTASAQKNDMWNKTLQCQHRKKTNPRHCDKPDKPSMGGRHTQILRHSDEYSDCGQMSPPKSGVVNWTVKTVMDEHENESCCDEECGTDKSGNVFIGQYLYELWQNQCLCDIRLQAGPKSFLAHKIVLAAFSDVFCPSSIHLNPCLTFTLPDTNPEAVSQILNYLYTAELEVRDETLEDILTTASCMGINEIVNMIRQILDNPTLENIDLYIDIRRRNGLPTCLLDFPSFVEEHFMDLMCSDHFLELKICQIEQLLSNPNLKVCEELDVLVAVSYWVEYDPSKRIACMGRLIGCVNFDLIDAEALSNFASAHKHLFSSKKAGEILMKLFRDSAIKNEMQCQNECQEKKPSGYRRSRHRLGRLSNQCPNRVGCRSASPSPSCNRPATPTGSSSRYTINAAKTTDIANKSATSFYKMTPDNECTDPHTYFPPPKVCSRYGDSIWQEEKPTCPQPHAVKDTNYNTEYINTIPMSPYQTYPYNPPCSFNESHSQERDCPKGALSKKSSCRNNLTDDESCNSTNQKRVSFDASC